MILDYLFIFFIVDSLFIMVFLKFFWIVVFVWVNVIYVFFMDVGFRCIVVYVGVIICICEFYLIFVIYFVIGRVFIFNYMGIIFFI